MHTKPQIEHDYLPHASALLSDTHVHKLSLTHPEINNRNISAKYMCSTYCICRIIGEVFIWRFGGLSSNPPNLNDVISDI